MLRHVASAILPCPQCGAPGKVLYGAALSLGPLRCSESFHCTSCGCAWEADDDELSERARAAFLAAEGRWRVTVDDLGPRRLEALRALRALLPEDAPADVLRKVRERIPIVDDVLVEARRAEAALAATGARVSMARVAEPSSGSHEGSSGRG